MNHFFTDARSATRADAWLRPLRSDDVEDVRAAFASDPEMARQGNAATLSDAEIYVAGLLEDESPHRPWAVVDRNRLVGLVCVSLDEENRNGWFWYWMNADSRGRGWTARAAATVAQWALAEGGLERLELGHRVNNPASAAVARAAGFVKEGTQREKFLVEGHRVDVDVYGRLWSDPAPRFRPLEMIDG
jgi:RimJ/RimL family protein N-acetyltransferase